MPRIDYTCLTTLSQCEICFNKNKLGLGGFLIHYSFIFIDVLRKANPTIVNF